jgi:hypothetical protein
MQSRKSTTTAEYETQSSPTPTPFGRGNGQSSSSSSFTRQPTQQEIARRAYEIYKSGRGGSQLDNWLRAERELRNEAA